MHHTRAILRGQGYRPTPQHSLIWKVLRDADRHLTAEEVAVEVRSTLPDVTVSRALELLAPERPEHATLRPSQRTSPRR